MQACILSTGDEVLFGDIVDTNSSYLCSRLKELGIKTAKIIAVGDDADTISKTITEIASEADICLVTGGLGPTEDDLTAAACAAAAGDVLQKNKRAFESMKAFFKKRGFPLTKTNEKQAFLPSRAEMIVNHMGTAPGFYMKIDRCFFYFMPGVPQEMKVMFEREVQKNLIDLFSLQENILLERYTVFGLGESKVGFLLRDFTEKFPGIRLGFRADFPLIEVKTVMTVSSADMQEKKKQMETAGQWIMDHLGNKIISDKGLDLAREVGRLLLLKGKTVAVAESCTGGLIANMMTNTSGSSDYFLFSAVAYSNEAKMDVLGVNQQTLVDHGAVSEQTALEMAEGARIKGRSDFAVSTTGIAGPSGGTDDKPVGTVCIGISGSDVSRARKYNFTFEDRLLNKQMFAAMALETLRRHLSSLERK